MERESLLRIIDANSNRAREGARVVEEIARFVLRDRELAGRWKSVRHSVSWLSARLEAEAVDCRDSEGDPGRRIDLDGENKRTDCSAVARANAKRAQEGIRVLEEFSKLISPGEQRAGLKELRFEVYALEKDTLSALDALNKF